MSKVTKEVTAANFKAALAATFRTVRSMRDRVQSLIVFAARHYGASGDAGYLTLIQTQASTVHGLNARGIQAYIQGCANVQLVNGEIEGTKNYRKVRADKGVDNPAVCREEVLTIPWYDWVAKNLGTNNAQADWTLDKLVSNVFATLKKHNVTYDEFAAKMRARLGANDLAAGESRKRKRAA